MSGIWDWVGAKLRGEGTKAEEAPERRPERSGPRCFMGLDFGTSGSKVVLRDAHRIEDPPIAVDFGTPSELGFSRFVMPSTVTIDSGFLHFGAEAEERRGDATYRSLKRRLIHVRSSEDKDGIGEIHPGLEGRAEDFEGFTGIYGIDDPRGTEFLATMLLAEIISRTHDTVEELFGPIDPSEVVVNLDVPVPSLDHGSARTGRFLRMLRIARRVAPQMPKPLSLADAASIYQECCEHLDEAVDDSEAREVIVPEAVAGIAGLGQAVRRTKNGNFAVVDIGAGTTDLGVFRFSPGLGRKTVFYSAATISTGCDRLDHAICGLLEVFSPDPEQLRIVRLQKTQIPPGGRILFPDRPRLTTEIIEQAAEEIRNHCFPAWQNTWGLAYGKEKNTDRWKNLKIFLIGGGSRIEALRRIYNDPPRDVVKHVEVVTPDEELQLRGAGASEQPPGSDDAVFLLTALGLSLPPPSRPHMVRPGEVKPMDPNSGPSGLYDFDADDLYSA